jgi:hypothetical protein
VRAVDWARAAVLTLAEFDVCWEALGLGETPWQLDPPRPGRTVPERQQVVAGAVDALQRRGLADARGPRPGLAEHLRLLAAPEWALDVRIRGRRLIGGLAAGCGRGCTLAVRHADEIAVVEVPAAAPALAELLGPVTPGPGAAVSVPSAVLDAAAGTDTAAPDDPRRLAAELVRRGTPDADAHALVAMCGGADQRGQFGSTAWTRSGRRRTPYVVGVHRTAAGHYVHLRRAARVTMAPLSGWALRQHLDEILEHVGAH